MRLPLYVPLSVLSECKKSYLLGRPAGTAIATWRRHRIANAIKGADHVPVISARKPAAIGPPEAIRYPSDCAMPESWAVSSGVCPRRRINESATTSAAPDPMPPISAHSRISCGKSRIPAMQITIGTETPTATFTWLLGVS